ncbi:MAG: hypothetical protein QNL62_07075 [Gammaproteobacteria bacterium]|nr:hypothetical protein [Gammaproteobacteria bacterium]
MHTLQLAFKLFQKELRQGELSLLFLSIVVAVGSLSCIGFFIQRIDHSMLDHATQLNGAQLILKSPSPVPSAWLKQADAHALRHAQMRAFPSMLVVNGQFKLAQIKAVSDNFPLQGELLVRKAAAKQAKATNAPAQPAKAPPRGEIWLDKRLALYFKLTFMSEDQQNGKRDALELGDSEFRASGILERVPGQSSSLFTIAPAAMINLADLARTATVQPGSRVDYLYFFSGPDSGSGSGASSKNALQSYRQWLKPQLRAGQTLRSGVEGLNAVNTNLKKAGDFLSLAALLTVLLAAIAISVNSHRFAQRQDKNCAIMLCLGCSEKRLISIELYKLLILAVLGSLAGIILGYTVYLGVLQMMNDLLPAANAQNSAMGLTALPAWVGLGSGVFLLLSLSMANLSRLKKLSPMALIRKDSSGQNAGSTLFYLLSVMGLLLISFFYTGNFKVTLWFYLVIILSSLVLYFVARFLLARVIQFARQYSLINRLSLLNLERHRQPVLLQIATFSMIFALLILIFLLRSELLDKWQQQFPAQTPNHFVINVQSYEREQFAHYLQHQSISNKGLYPMVRGRLSHLNQRPIKELISETAQQHNALHRELNLSFSKTMPVQGQQQSQILSGRGWQENASLQNVVPGSKEKNGTPDNTAPAKISLESGLAKALNIEIGDTLGFQIGSQSISGLVYNIRKVQWDSFQPNFYIIFSPGLIEHYPVTWIASFYLARGDKHKLNELIEKFPGITIIEVDELLREVQYIIEKISHAIEFIFLFIIAAGMLVLSASLSSTLDVRMYENAVIRTLGASARQLRRCLLVEFVVVAVLSALMAIVLAELASFVLYKQVFNISYALHPLVWIGITTAALLLICGLGLIVVNKVFTQSSHASLNQFV